MVKKCCRTCRPYSGIASRCRTASVNRGYIDETALGRNACQRARCKCRCLQRKRCNPPPPREYFKLDIPRLALNGPLQAPTALTRQVPCSTFGYESGAAAFNTLFPARYPTTEESACAAL